MFIPARARRAADQLGKTTPHNQRRPERGVGTLAPSCRTALLGGSQHLPEQVRPVRDNPIKRTFDVMIADLKMLKMKIWGINPEWEKFKQWDELARKK